jgi:hypothetical protein
MVAHVTVLGASHNLGIYAENDEDEDINELDQYFEEKHKGHQVSF